MLVLISTYHRRALLAFPAPFLYKKGEKDESASLKAQLGQQEVNVCVLALSGMDPGFDVKQPA